MSDGEHRRGTDTGGDGAAATVASLDPAHLPPGYTVAGKYVIKRLLGEGANGSVYEGEHSEIGHRVAIKVVHKNLAARTDIIARFRREARICGTIRNRHVGQVYDVGELQSGAPYMVMELQEGRSLAKLLEEERRLPISTAVDIGRQLLVGLQAAHDIGAIHRDVKPDNIMLVRESTGHTVVKLVDFGIGKSVHADIKNRNVTQEGMVVGSPDYMPPEQLKGEEVDHRVDVYAAGIVLYEMITGTVPFNAETLTELFVAILRDPVKAPSTLRSDCVPELEQVIMRAMDRDAAKRFQSAAEMDAALQQAQRLAGVSSDGLRRVSQPPAPQKRLRTTEGYALETERVRTAELQLPIKRGGSRMLLIGGGVVAIAAAAVAVLTLGPARDSGAEHRVTPRPESAQPGAAASAAPPSTPALPAAPAPAPETEPAAPAPADVEAAPIPAAPAPAAAEADAHGDEAAGGGAKREHRSKRERGKGDREKDAPAAATPAKASVSEVEGESAAELVNQASAAFIQGQLPRARALYREVTAKVPSHADAWRGLGMVSSRMGQPEEAKRAFQRYLSLRPNAPDAAAIQKKLEAL